MKKITVFTKDRLLFRKLYLLFEGEYELEMCEKSDASRGEIVILDSDTVEGDIRFDIILSRREKPDAIRVPFLLSDMENAVKNAEKRNTGALFISEGEREIRLRGERIKLTEVEHKLLLALARAPRGAFVSREQLVNEVWGGECDLGVVNVYIHYLREKTEKSGARVIASSRREGYKIDEGIEIYATFN